MRLRFFAVSLLLAFLLFTGTAFSQTFTGLFDGYYGYNFNKPANQNNQFINGTPSRAFDVNSQMFSLNYAEIAVEQKPTPVGYRFDFGFGDTARVVNSSEPSSADLQHIQQAFVTVKKGNMNVDFGKFVTPLGAEVIETKDNWNYSRSVLFTYAIPFYHFGVRTTYAASDKMTFAAYLVNGWNNVRDNNGSKSLGLMLTLKPSDKLTLTENYLGGKESPISSDNTRHMFDSVATYTMSPKFSAMANYDYGFDMLAANRRMWQGIAGYGKISFNGKDTGLKLVPRYEYYYDKNGATTGINQKLQEGTLTFQMVSKDAGTFWAEYRRDWSDQEAFLNNKDSGAVPRLNQDIVVIGYTYSFSKEVK
jgi:hypothetical protein